MIALLMNECRAGHESALAGGAVGGGVLFPGAGSPSVATATQGGDVGEIKRNKTRVED